jgi:hypothetical protein
MRETRSSGSVEGVVGNHDPYSDFLPVGVGKLASLLSQLVSGPRHVKPSVPNFSLWAFLFMSR